MEGIIDEEQPGSVPVNQLLATAAGQPGADGMQPGPFGDLVSQFQYNRNSGDGAAAAAGAYTSGLPQQPALQQPVLNWGNNVDSSQAAALAHMAGMAADGTAGEDTDAAYRDMKRQRMHDGAGAATGMEELLAAPAPHTSGSSNQLQALGQGGNGASWQGGNNSSRMVEGNDLSQVYEQARQQQQMMQQQQAMMGMPGAGSDFGNVPINSLDQQMLMQQQGYGAAGLPQNSNMRLQRLDRYGGSYGRPPASSNPTRLTTGHKHQDYLQQLVRARFNQQGSAPQPTHGMVTRNAGAGLGSYGMPPAAQNNFYQRFPLGRPGSQGSLNKSSGDDEDADQLLSKCEAVSAAWQHVCCAR